MKNLIAMNDTELSRLYHRASQEIVRRQQAATGDMAIQVRGQEYAKRALQIAAVGDLSVTLAGPAGCGKTMLRALGRALGVEKTFEARLCLCGNYGDSRVACSCSPRGIEECRDTLPIADLFVECRPFHASTLEESWGEPIQKIKARVDRARKRTAPTQLEPAAAKLLKAAIDELGLNAATMETVKKVAGAIAQLEGEVAIRIQHIGEAVSYRFPGKLPPSE